MRASYAALPGFGRIAEATTLRDWAAMAGIADYEWVDVPDRAAWRAWLKIRHDTSPGIWLVYHRQGSPGTSPTYDEAVEEAICFGWIDSLLKRLDEHRSRQLFTPRRSASTWSAINKDRVARLERSGLIAPSGAAVIAAARADGSWAFLDDVEALVVPADLAAALQAAPGAAAGFERYPPSVKKPYLWWVKSAKRPTTRARRIAEVVERASRGLRPGQPL